MLGGARSFAAIGEWVGDLPADALARLGLSGRIPGPVTIWRVLVGVDRAALEAAVGAWIRARLKVAEAAVRRPRGRRGRARRVLAVDGKAMRATGHGAEAVHLLGVLDHTRGVVLAQVDVDAKTNEVRHGALCCIPDSVGMDSEGGSWARRLTWIRKVKGTRACRDSCWPCPGVWSGAAVSPRDMAKAELPESQSPAMQVFIHRKWRLKPVPRPASVYLVGGRTFRDVGRCPVRAFKGMSGTPKSRCDVRQRRTWDRLPDASPMATECPQ